MIKKKKLLHILDKASRNSLARKYRHLVDKDLRRMNCKTLEKNQIEQIKKEFAGVGVTKLNTGWHRLYAWVHGEFSPRYIPEDLYYSQIEPEFNQRKMFPALVDKNLLSRLFPGTTQPRTILKNCNGYFLSGKDELLDPEGIVELLSNHDRFIIKPSIDSGGGKKVKLVTKHNKTQESHLAEIKALLNSYGKDFLAQEVLEQGSELSKLNPTSLNTMRIMTLLTSKGVRVISSYVRMGKMGAFVDNVNSGGMCCGIDQDGRLKQYAFTKDYSKFEATEKGNKFTDIKIPQYENILNHVKNLHRMVPYFRLISWDIAQNENNDPVLIEFNVFYQEINSHQITNGPVLFQLFEELADK